MNKIKSITLQTLSTVLGLRKKGYRNWSLGETAIAWGLGELIIQILIMCTSQAHISNFEYTTFAIWFLILCLGIYENHRQINKDSDFLIQVIITSITHKSKRGLMPSWDDKLIDLGLDLGSILQIVSEAVINAGSEQFSGPDIARYFKNTCTVGDLVWYIKSNLELKVINKSKTE